MLTKFLYRQTLELLQREAEKSILVERLETANQELAVINRHLQALAATDALTNVANRRAFDLAVTREWRRLSREALPLGMIILDVDHFKSYNDLHGHPAGDACLRTIIAAAASVIKRPTDLLARYGGEEFAVILPATYLDGAVQIAEQLRRVIAEHAVPHDASPFSHVTVSVGVACMLPNEHSVIEQLTARADAALYMAKRGGRNRVYAVELGDSGPEAIPGLQPAVASA